MMSSINNTDFFQHYKSDVFKQTNKSCTIRKIKKGDGIIYGSLIIPYNDKGIHEWKLKIPSKIKACTVGISEPAEVFSGKGQVHYGYCSNGKRRGPNGIESHYSDPYNGDIISVVLDLSQKKKQLKFKKNNGPMRAAFDIAKAFGYSLAVYIGDQDVNSNIQLLSYTCNKSSKYNYKSSKYTGNKQDKVKHHYIYQPSSNDVYQPSFNDLLFENDQLKQQVDDLLFENDKLNQNLEECQMQIDSLLCEQSRLQKPLAENNCKLTDKVNRQSSTIQKMGRLMADLVAENNGLKAVNSKIVERYESKINELMKMNDGNVINYKQWDANKICLWIISLGNGRLSKYEQILRKSLNEEGICGDDLDEVDGSDIKGWGIVNFKDKKFLQQKIKDLIKARNDKNNDEGCYQKPTQQT